MIKNNYKSIAVLIPAYEPGGALRKTTDELLAKGLKVVVVDDGSGEDFARIFNTLSGKVTQTKHHENRGKGAALKTGYQFIQQHLPDAKIIITADADGQHRPSDIVKLAENYHKHQGKLLLGVRNFDKKNVPLRSRFGNVLTRKVFSLVARQNLTDTQTGLRAFSTELIDFMCRVPGERFEYETNVLLACSREDIEIVEQKIATIYENNNQSSHFNAIADSLSIYWEIIKFASSSLLCFVVDYLLFILLVQLTGSWGVAASVTFANITARIVSASLNFSLNRKVVFRHDGNLARGALQYFALAVFIMLAGTLVLNVLVALGLVPYIAKIITELGLFIVSFVLQKKIIFKK